MKEKEYLYIFLHIPKTGGTTFSRHLVKNLPNEQILLTSERRYGKNKKKYDKEKVKVILGHATYYGIHKKFPNKIPRYIVFLRDPAERFVSGYNFEMRTKKGKNILFWKWYSSQVKNEMIYFLDMKFKGKSGTKINLPPKTFKYFLKPFASKKIYFFLQNIFEKYILFFGSSNKKNKQRLSNSKKILDECWHIGFVENLDQSLKYLFKEIGVSTKWKNKNKTPSNKNFFILDDVSRRKIYSTNKYDEELIKYASFLKKSHSAR